MTYYFVFAFSTKVGHGIGNNCFNIDNDSISVSDINEIMDTLYNAHKDEWTDKPVILNWKKLGND